MLLSVASKKSWINSRPFRWEFVVPAVKAFFEPKMVGQRQPRLAGLPIGTATATLIVTVAT